jgi:hypothetical protein
MQEMGLGTRPKSMKADFGLGYMLGLRQGKSGRKKRMDKAWWKDIQQVPIFDPACPRLIKASKEGRMIFL